MESHTIDCSESRAGRTFSGGSEKPACATFGPPHDRVARTLPDAFLAPARGGGHANRWRVIAAVLWGSVIYTGWDGCSSKKSGITRLLPGLLSSRDDRNCGTLRP